MKPEDLIGQRVRLTYDEDIVYEGRISIVEPGTGYYRDDPKAALYTIAIESISGSRLPGITPRTELKAVWSWLTFLDS